MAKRKRKPGHTKKLPRCWFYKKDDTQCLKDARFTLQLKKVLDWLGRPFKRPMYDSRRYYSCKSCLDDMKRDVATREYPWAPYKIKCVYKK